MPSRIAGQPGSVDRTKQIGMRGETSGRRRRAREGAHPSMRDRARAGDDAPIVRPAPKMRVRLGGFGLWANARYAALVAAVAGAALASARTETRLRSWPVRSNRTTPSTRAKRVWSRPIPTLTPGRMTVPCCRMMMVPARTVWPAPVLMPSRWPTLSRPLRELPAPFLCAISFSFFFARGRPLPGCRRGSGLGLFFAGRFSLPRPADGADPDLRQQATMAHFAPLPLLRSIFEHDHLVAGPMRDHGGLDRGAGDEGRADGGVLPAGNHQHRIQANRVAHLGGDPVNHNPVAFRYSKLPSAGLDNGKHWFTRPQARLGSVSSRIHRSDDADWVARRDERKEATST